jgi:hypothetical protein
MKQALILLAVVFGTIGVACAGALDRQQIPAGSAWVFHFDLDGFRLSQFGQLVTDEIGASHHEKINALQELLGSNLLTDIRSVTLYGADADEKNVVSLIKGTYNREKLTAVLKLNSTYAEIPHGDITLYSWVDDKSKRTQVGAFAGDNLIAISQSQQALETALNVLDKQQPALADQPQQPLYALTEASEEAFIVAAAEGISDLAGNEHAAILKNSNFVVFITSEQAGNLKARLQLESESEEAAVNIEKFVRGMLALAELKIDNQPQFTQILRSAGISRAGKTLEFNLSAPSQLLFDMIQSHIKADLDFRGSLHNAPCEQ